jgi:hypothetical protein
MSSHLMLGRLKLAERGFAGRSYHIFDSFEGLSEPGANDAIAEDDPKAARLSQIRPRPAPPDAGSARVLLPSPGRRRHRGMRRLFLAWRAQRHQGFLHAARRGIRSDAARPGDSAARPMIRDP